MSKTLIGLIVAVLALGVAIYFFQGKIISTTPAETEQTEHPTQTMPVKDLPPTMEDGTIEPGSTTTPNIY